MHAFSLTRPRTALVECERLSGQTASGIFVLDHDDARNMRGDAISLLWRVQECTPDCRYLKRGAVYTVKNPYAFMTITHEGVDYRVMHEDNMLAELEDYDTEAFLNEQEAVDSVDSFPVCGK